MFAVFSDDCTLSYYFAVCSAGSSPDWFLPPTATGAAVTDKMQGRQKSPDFHMFKAQWMPDPARLALAVPAPPATCPQHPLAASWGGSSPARGPRSSCPPPAAASPAGLAAPRCSAAAPCQTHQQGPGHWKGFVSLNIYLWTVLQQKCWHTFCFSCLVDLH